jgi:hypothetical protein
VETEDIAEVHAEFNKEAPESPAPSAAGWFTVIAPNQSQGVGVSERIVTDIGIPIEGLGIAEVHASVVGVRGHPAARLSKRGYKPPLPSSEFSAPSSLSE